MEAVLVPVISCDDAGGVPLAPHRWGGSMAALPPVRMRPCPV